MNELTKEFPDIPKNVIMGLLYTVDNDLQRCREKIEEYKRTKNAKVLFPQILLPNEQVPPKIPQVRVIARQDNEVFQRIRPRPQRERRNQRNTQVPRESSAPTVALPKREVQIKGIKVTIPVLPQEARKLIDDAINLGTEINYGKASSYLNVIIQKNSYPDDIVDRLLLASCDDKQPASSLYYTEFITILSNLFPRIAFTCCEKRKIISCLLLFISSPLSI